MILILNEKKLLKKSLKEGYIDYKKPSNTIRILAKHYFSIGMNIEQVYDSIDIFFKKYYKKYNNAKWQNAFDRIIKRVHNDKKYELLDINSVKVTKNELKRIKNLDNIKYEKLAFVLLVYAKIYNQMNNTNLGWVNIEQKYIFSDAKLKENKYNQGIMLHIFEEMRLISVSNKVNCTNIKVNFIDEVSEVILEINDFRNYVYEYLRWNGENIINCQNDKCNILFVPNNNKSKYCPTCAKEIEKNNWVERKRRQRNKNVTK